MRKIHFKREHNDVKAFRAGGRIGSKLLPNEGATAEQIEEAMTWAYELGRRDRNWEFEKFLEGHATEAIEKL